MCVVVAVIALLLGATQVCLLTLLALFLFS